MKKKYFLFFLFTVISMLFAENSETLEEIEIIKNRTGENKAGIYFKNIEQDKAVIFLDGFWDSELLGTTGFEFFNGYTKVNPFQPVFKQKANLSLWLLLNKQFYFETLYKDDYKKSVLALGYFGKDNSVIKHIRVGNSGIKFPSRYGFIKPGGGNIIAPGIMTTFSGKNWNADAMLRYESAEYNSKLYYGNNEVIKTTIPIHDWLRAQYFYIPCADLYGKKIRVFVRDYSDSDWRELPNNEFAINQKEKTLALKKSYPYGVAINYFYVSDAESTQAANEFLKKIEKLFEFAGEIRTVIKTDIKEYKIENSKFLLKDKSSFSPFEIASRYKFNKQYSAAIKVLDLTTETELPKPVASIKSTEIFSDDLKKIEFIQLENNYNSYDMLPENMFPFSDSDYKIYLPENSAEVNSDKAVLFETYVPVSDIVLNENVIPGTIRIYKNKIEIFDFEYDERNNFITLKQEILQNDLIEIRWQESKTYSDSGTVKSAAGIHWQPLNFIDIFFAGAGDWTVSKQAADLYDSYKISSGIKFEKYNMIAGSEFGFNIYMNRNKKTRNYIFDNKTYFTYHFDGIVYEKKKEPVFSNPHIYIDGNVKTESQIEKAKINSKMEAGFDLWKINLGGSLSLHNKNKHNGFVESYGHSIVIPVYFFNAAEHFFVNRNEEVLRRNCKIEFEKYLSLKYLTSIDYTKEFTNQKISASISPIIPEKDFGNIYAQISFTANQKYGTIYNASHLSYGKSWKKSLIEMYSSGNENASNRNSELKVIFNLFSNSNNSAKKISLLGFNFESAASAKIYNSTNQQCEEQTKFSISFPFEAAHIFFTPIFERKIIKQKSGIIQQNTYDDDMRNLFTGMGEQYWMFSKPVFYDLVDKKINKQLQLNNPYNYAFYNLYGFNISRLIDTAIKSLYLPLEFNSNFIRLVKSEKSLPQAANIYFLDFLIKYTSLNISGKYGYFHWFNRYEQDELNRLYKWSFSFGKEFFKFNFDSHHSVYIFWGNGSSIKFENDFNYSILQSAKIKMDNWKEKIGFAFISESNYSLPHFIIQYFTKLPLSDNREEKISVELSRELNSKKLNYAVLFRHSQITKINNHGEVKLFAEFSGASTSKNSFLLNISAGISGKVEY